MRFPTWGGIVHHPNELIDADQENWIAAPLPKHIEYCRRCFPEPWDDPRIRWVQGLP